jgi:predicted Zn-dependent peptidase
VLSNGVALHAICAGPQEVVRVSVIFAAGSRFQPQRLVASATVALMSEGTAQRSGAQLAEQLDFYGATYEHHLDKDYAMLTVYALTRYLPQALEVLREMALSPSFPEGELRTYCAKRKQQLRIDKERVAYVARERLQAELYGAAHPYGAYAEPEDYDSLRREMLQEFHRRHFTGERCFVVAAGGVGEREAALIGRYFEDIPQGSAATEPPLPALPQPQEGRTVAIAKEGALQSALRVGKVLFGRSHPDFAGVHVLSVVLGGYFGSRLMRNIREDKGYTYGIFASLVNFRQAGHLAISAEVGQPFGRAALGEIRQELQRLCDEKISEDELRLVKNYLCGEIMRSLDGPWALAETAIEDLQANLPQSYVCTLFDAVRSATAEQLQGLAQKYLLPESMTSIVVG